MPIQGHVRLSFMAFILLFLLNLSPCSAQQDLAAAMQAMGALAPSMDSLSSAVKDGMQTWNSSMAPRVDSALGVAQSTMTRVDDVVSYIKTVVPVALGFGTVWAAMCLTAGILCCVSGSRRASGTPGDKAAALPAANPLQAIPAAKTVQANPAAKPVQAITAASGAFGNNAGNGVGNQNAWALFQGMRMV